MDTILDQTAFQEAVVFVYPLKLSQFGNTTRWETLRGPVNREALAYWDWNTTFIMVNIDGWRWFVSIGVELGDTCDKWSIAVDAVYCWRIPTNNAHLNKTLCPTCYSQATKLGFPFFPLFLCPSLLLTVNYHVKWIITAPDWPLQVLGPPSPLLRPPGTLKEEQGKARHTKVLFALPM